MDIIIKNILNRSTPAHYQNLDDYEKVQVYITDAYGTILNESSLKKIGITLKYGYVCNVKIDIGNF